MRLFSLTFFVLSQKGVPRKHWQIVLAGGFASGGSTARALAFSSVCGVGWHDVLLVVRSPATWLTSSPFHAFWLLSAHSIQGVPFSGTVTCSDASPWRGAVCVSHGTGIKTAWHLPEEEVTLFSAFDGIGGFFLAWDRLGLAGTCPVNPASIRVPRRTGLCQAPGRHLRDRPRGSQGHPGQDTQSQGDRLLAVCPALT